MRENDGHSHRGLIGLEAALIIIALVIVAAAMAVVVLNMGIFTAQEARTAIGATLRGTESILVVEGKVIASSYQASNPSSLNATSIPIKIARGGVSVNLDPGVTAVKYQSNLITYDDIYAGTLMPDTYTSLQTAMFAAQAVPFQYIDEDPFQGGNDADSDDWPDETTAFIYWTLSANTNEILEVGEHAVLAIVFAAGDRPEYLDEIRVEIILQSGATLTVERKVPVITNEVVELG